MELYEIAYSEQSNRFIIPENAVKPQGLSLAIGFFDGVHLGHREVIRRAVSLGNDRGQTPAVLTFDPHPRVVLGKDQYHSVLTPMEHKLELFAENGVEESFIMSFDKAFSQVTAERFVRELLLPLGVRTVVIGFDFRFGHRGQGDAELLKQAGEGRIDVHVVEPVYRDGFKVSSSRIRELLSEGSSSEASGLLARPYEVRGEVVHGKALGRQLGFPTANISPAFSYFLPKHGVYAVTVTLEDDEEPAVYHGVINVGLRPTVDTGAVEPKLEVHLLDFNRDLYGRNLKVRFHDFLRPEMKFGSLDALIEQIGKDAEAARNRLALL
ncbi:bifunctional riboflavin kinase/FAD synthetase [Cohnella thailandensis]|uniref:Riboflavin biosynthesis protein n=1 Tax=Cohnella thailandensis TaxID=557557 RepID=A0A841T3V8_9BACL|nr:bifunctional riboflavin kinase/FAD synthetase [Cohnella thailandensis]MBP1973374.1 riboflavin kinase/FMN adenylyltransferase [Cohnella thailandensis]